VSGRELFVIQNGAWLTIFIGKGIGKMLEFYKKLKNLFEIVFEGLKNAFNTKKVCLKKKNTCLANKLKAFLNVQ
jgi:hypothetical protein